MEHISPISKIEDKKEPILKKEFYQALWYDSIDGIITRESIEKNLIEFLAGNKSRTVAFTRTIKKGSQRLVSQDLFLSKSFILGKIDFLGLKNLHKQIKEATDPIEKESLANLQINIIIKGIQACLDESSDSKVAELRKEEIRQLLLG